jgi:hypothetical protein
MLKISIGRISVFNTFAEIGHFILIAPKFWGTCFSKILVVVGHHSSHKAAVAQVFNNLGV